MTGFIGLMIFLVVGGGIVSALMLHDYGVRLFHR